MSETKNLLEVNDLKMHFATGSKGLFSKEKNYVYAVDGVNFSIRPGETLGLVQLLVLLHKSTNQQVVKFFLMVKI